MFSISKKNSFIETRKIKAENDRKLNITHFFLYNYAKISYFSVYSNGGY